PESVSSFAATSLPFVLAAHRAPETIAALDDELDATVLCTVARRASTAQGRALLALWERSLGSAVVYDPAEPPGAAAAAIAGFSTLAPRPAAHLAPLLGAVARACGLSSAQAAHAAVLAHARAVVSAAVRAGLLGPYAAQSVLAGVWLRGIVERAVAREWCR